jgi:hypothetical protein
VKPTSYEAPHYAILSGLGMVVICFIRSEFFTVKLFHIAIASVETWAAELLKPSIVFFNQSATSDNIHKDNIVFGTPFL